MSTNGYQDDNTQTPPPQVQPIVTKSPSIMDYIRSHKLLIFIAIVIIAGLIWWFCIRKNGNGSTSASSNGFTITKSKY